MIIEINHIFGRLTVTMTQNNGHQTALSIDAQLEDICVGSSVVERVKDEWGEELENFYKGEQP